MSEPIYARATGWHRSLASTTKKLQPVFIGVGWQRKYVDNGSDRKNFIMLGLGNRETGTAQSIVLTDEQAERLIATLTKQLAEVREVEHDEEGCDCPAHGGPR